MRLPTRRDVTTKGLSSVSYMGYLVFGSNVVSAFVTGFIIAGAFNNSIAEGIAIMTALLITEILHKVSDYARV